MKNIYLVGFMATGKTCVGKELAKRFNREFFDLDDLIERKENMAIVDIFKQKGEPYFRKIEKEIVKEISLKEDLVVGCGGGAIVDKDGLAILKKSGLVICLKADANTILERTKVTTQRPLLNVQDPKGRVNDLLKKRESFYNQADYSVDTTNLEIGEVVDKIIIIIKGENIS